jgi:hypothetical protein
LSWEDEFSHAEWLALDGAAHGEGDVYADPALAESHSTHPPDLCPAATSPAVDQAPELGLTEDFFGAPRPVGGGFDLGACERQ